MRTTLSILMASALVLLASGCGKGDEDHDHAAHGDSGHSEHSDEGSHGGHLVELGSAAHLEFVHDSEAGTVTIFLTGPDGKTPLVIPKAPILKLQTAQGQKILPTSPTSGSGAASSFSLSDAALKSEELSGRLATEIEGKTYNSLLKDLHDHDHDEDH